MLIDVSFALLILLAFIKGIRKGFIIALFSFIAFIVGIAAALKLSAVVAVRLSESLDVSAQWLPLISYTLVFLAVVFLINITGKLIQKTMELAMLGWLNRIGGALLFLLLYGIIYSIFLFYAVQLHIIKPETISASTCYPYVKPLGPKIISSIGYIIPAFKNIFEELEHFFYSVSNKIRH